jgi:hypothetical protein
MKILITGSRTWTDELIIIRELSKFPSGTIIIHGAARGADSLADRIAKSFGFVTRPYPVTPEDWEKIGPRAGILRNSSMLSHEHPDSDGIQIDLCLAFTDDYLKNSRGTHNMVQQATRAGIKVKVVETV